jgi:hypothetical protein
MISPDVPQYFIPVRRRASAAQSFVYLPMLYGEGEVHISDTKGGVDAAIAAQTLFAITNDPVPVNWDNALACEIEIGDLEKEASESTAAFGELPSIATKAKSYESSSKDFANWLYRTQSLTLFESAAGVCSRQGESERDFRVRLQQSTRESRDRDVEQLRKKYASKISGLEDRIRRAQQAQELQQEQAKAAKMQTAISFGATILGGLLGRKGMSLGTVGRATTAARGVSRSMKESADVARAGETVEAVTRQLQELNAELELEISRLTSTSDVSSETLQTISIKPKKKDIQVKLITLVWAPHVQETGKPPEPAW